MARTEQKKKLLTANIAVALHDELGRVPREEEIHQAFTLARVLYKVVLGRHYKRQEQKKSGQLALFSAAVLAPCLPTGTMCGQAQGEDDGVCRGSHVHLRPPWGRPRQGGAACVP